LYVASVGPRLLPSSSQSNHTICYSAAAAAKLARVQGEPSPVFITTPVNTAGGSTSWKEKGFQPNNIIATCEIILSNYEILFPEYF
jgi:hypothetical protein